jgi:plastocyanin
MPIRTTTFALLGLMLLTGGALAQGYQPGTATPETAFAPSKAREFWIATVHLDGNTGLQASADHPAEPFPTAALPAGGGLLLTQPGAEGKWRMRAFVFQPAQVVVREGETVVLHFVGVQGPAHRIAVEGQGEPFVLRRGETRSVTLTPEAAGSIRWASLDRLPSMTGEILVLPRAR